MFIGHYAVAFASKRWAPRTSLGVLAMAGVFLDLLWPIFLLLGWEQVRILPGITPVVPLDFVWYPWTHSLAAVALWAVGLGMAYFLITRNRSGGFWVGLLVISHWFLDWVTHRPDLPLYPGGSGFGLEAWRSISVTLILEMGLLAGGMSIYLNSTRAIDGIGRWGLGSFVALLAILYGGSVFGPPPPSEQAIAYSGLGQWLFVLAAGWIDRHREPRLKA